MNVKRWIALGICSVLVLFYVTGHIVVQFMSSSDLFTMAEQDEWKEEIVQRGGEDKIALLEVEGIITDQPTGGFLNQIDYNHRLFLKQLEHAFQDETIKGILLRVNSPGGGVVESDEIYHNIIHLKEEHQKPIVTYMANMAASGGYYISAPTDQIYANRSTLTGSIGVIMSSYNVQELAENWGVKEETFKSGVHKDIMSPMREMTDEERRIMQSIVDESYGNFLDVIVAGRKDKGMTKDKLLPLADGRIFTGKQAKDVGLIDEIGFLDDAIQGTAALAEIEDPTVVKFKKSGLSAFNNMFATLQGKSNDLLGIKEIIHTQHNPSLMYLFKW